MSRRNRYISDAKWEKISAWQDARPLVVQLFKNLRKAGVVARMNFSCCGGCAGYELAQKFPNQQPVVYYHRQSHDRTFNEGGGLMLQYGYSNSDDAERDAALGRQIVEAARALGFVVNWDGSANTCVELLPPEQPEPCATVGASLASAGVYGDL